MAAYQDSRYTGDFQLYFQGRIWLSDPSLLLPPGIKPSQGRVSVSWCFLKGRKQTVKWRFIEVSTRRHPKVCLPALIPSTLADPRCSPKSAGLRCLWLISFCLESSSGVESLASIYWAWSWSLRLSLLPSGPGFHRSWMLDQYCICSHCALVSHRVFSFPICKMKELDQVANNSRLTLAQACLWTRCSSPFPLPSQILAFSLEPVSLAKYTKEQNTLIFCLSLAEDYHFMRIQQALH